MNLTRLAVIACAGAALTAIGAAAHADAAAGRATFTKVCAECHEASDFDGEDPKAIAATLKGIVAGTQKHKKALKLTDQEVADVAAFMAAGGK